MVTVGSCPPGANAASAQARTTRCRTSLFTPAFASRDSSMALQHAAWALTLPSWAVSAAVAQTPPQPAPAPLSVSETYIASLQEASLTVVAPGVQFAGEAPLSTLRSPSLEACAASCARDQRCVTWNFQPCSQARAVAAAAASRLPRGARSAGSGKPPPANNCSLAGGLLRKRCRELPAAGQQLQPDAGRGEARQHRRHRRR